MPDRRRDAAARVTVERFTPDDAESVTALLVELALDEQERYDHPRHSREQVEATTLPPAPGFTGENVVLVARLEDSPGLVGVCWVVLFDPGTGLEAEVAELYVAPWGRGRGVAGRLLREAMELLRVRNVTFACVWTRGDNPAALAAYRRAGFAPTVQTVLTWLPLDG